MILDILEFRIERRKKNPKKITIPIIQYEHKQKHIFQKYVNKSENIFQLH